MNLKYQRIIDFSKDGNSLDFSTYGWSFPENHGTWMDGQDAGITITDLDPQSDYLVEVHVFPFLALPELRYHNLVLKISGAEMLQEQIITPSTLRFDLSASAISVDGKIDFEIFCSTATSPRALGLNMDSRRLSVSISRIILTNTSMVAESSETSDAKIDDTPIYLNPDLTQTAKQDGRAQIAAVTMVYNEPEYLSIWIRHYSKHVGLANCFIIDHGSDDGSTENLIGCNVIKVPRDSYDPVVQSLYNSKFCSSLLCWYKRIIYSDVDEILVPDPNIAETLFDYCSLPLPDVVTAIGLNVQQIPDLEAAIDITIPISNQRSWVLASASMCKPLLINRDIRWSGGSHSADAKLVFDHLYMFHLRWFDFDIGMTRLARTRKMNWAPDASGQHARLNDDDWTRQFYGFSALPRYHEAAFDQNTDPLSSFLNSVRQSQAGREFSLYKIDLSIWAQNLWRIPQRFAGTF
jgi:hypothetical protein